MNIIYYVEINLICIVFLLLFRGQLHNKSEQFSTARILFSILIWATIFLCAFDMAAGIFRGQVFFGARAILEVSNLLYFEALAVISYLWMLYVFAKLKILMYFDRKKVYIWAIPLIIFTLIAVSNPFTHVLFTLDENNLYSRGPGVYFHWFVNWLYLIVPTVKTAAMIVREKNKQKRQEITPLLYFIIAPIIACVLQMAFYGVSSAQAGITISITIIFLVVQSNQVLTDALTGLNNRRGLDKYLSDLVHSWEAEIFILMIDINNFKQVNDRFGHMEGDHALSDVAEVLKRIGAEMPSKLFLCRYGGDEFLIAGGSRSRNEIEDLKVLIRSGLKKKSEEKGSPYILEVSIGAAKGRCMDLDDAQHLIRVADEAMYDDKKRWRKMGAEL